MKERKISVDLKTARRTRKWWMWILAVVIVGGGVGAWLVLTQTNTFTAKAENQSDSDYYTSPVRVGDIIESSSGSGTLEASNSVDLSFSTAGTVKSLNVAVGDQVTAGETLAELVNTESLEAAVASAQLAYLQAQQDMDDLYTNADQSLAQAYLDYLDAEDSANEADETQQKTTSSRCSTDQLKSLSTQLERAKERLSKLTSENTDDEWDDAKSQYQTVAANYAYCISYTDLEKTQASAEATVAANTLQSTESTYNTLKDNAGIDPNELTLAEVTLRQAELDLTVAKKNLEGATITSPIDGTVMSIAAGEGEYVSDGTYITVSDRTDPQLTIYMDESDLDYLVVGTKVEITFDAVPDQTFTGEITEVDPLLYSTDGYSVVTGIAKITDDSFTSIANTLPLGLSASVEVILAESKDVLEVPVEAVHDLGDGQYAVSVVNDDGSLSLRVVEVGLMDDAFAEIKSGLSEGEIVSTGTVETTN